MSYTYKFRGLPCNIRRDPWYVSGSYADGSGGGVLEWGYSESDVQALMLLMKRDPQFTNLKVGQHKDR